MSMIRPVSIQDAMEDTESPARLTFLRYWTGLRLLLNLLFGQIVFVNASLLVIDNNIAS